MTDVSDVLVSTPQGQVLQAKNLMTRRRRGRARRRFERKNQQRIAYVSAEPEIDVERSGRRGAEARLPQIYG